MHIFLTGEIGVGKSTALQKFLTITNAAADGFRTFFENRGSDNRRLQLERYDTLTAVMERKCAVQFSNGNAEVYAEVFEEYGTEIVENSGKRDYIVFDELGVFEECAPKFKAAVLKKLDADKTVVGVVKAKNSPFLDAVRSHPNTILLTVDETNRENIPLEIFKASHVKRLLRNCP